MLENLASVPFMKEKRTEAPPVFSSENTDIPACMFDCSMDVGFCQIIFIHFFLNMLIIERELIIMITLSLYIQGSDRK